MHSWLTFLQENSCLNYADTVRHNLHIKLNAKYSIKKSTNFIIPLTNLGLILLTGKDAITFLQRQITNDVITLNQNLIKLAGYCDPKGRLLATFFVLKSFDYIILQLPKTLQTNIQKRLQQFVMRDKVNLTDINTKYVIFGLSGDISILSQWFSILPMAPYYKVEHASHGTLIRITDSCHCKRYQWLTTPKIAIEAWPILTKALDHASINTWNLTDIYAGIPTINLTTQGKFIPQTINLELIDGIDFKKGCYPGQEVIARTQYLGKLKRRTTLGFINTAEIVQPGMELFNTEDVNQPCGMIINAERITLNSWACLIEIRLNIINKGNIHLKNLLGPIVKLGTLPYLLK